MQNMKTRVVSIGPFTKICRICLQETQRQRNIFGPPNGQPAEHLRYVTDLKVVESDKLPQQVCEQCLQHLNIAASLKKKAIASCNMLSLLVGVSAGLETTNQGNVSNVTKQSVGDKEMAKTMIRLVDEIGMEMSVVKEEPKDNEYIVKQELDEDSVHEEPSVEDEVFEESVVEEPMVEESVIEEPMVEDNMVEDTVVEDSVLEDTMVEDPLIEQPLVEDPEVEEHTVEEHVYDSSDPRAANSIRSDLVAQLNTYESDEVKYEIIDIIEPASPSEMIEVDVEYAEEDILTVMGEDFVTNEVILGNVSDDENTLMDQFIIDETCEEDRNELIRQLEDSNNETGLKPEGDVKEEISHIPTVELILPVDDGSVPKVPPKKKQRVIIDGKTVSLEAPTIKVYACDMCNFQTDMRHKLNTHMKRHMNKLDYKCSFEGCNSAFISQGLLTVHERKHTRDKLPTCEVCSKTFINKVGLMNHMSYIHKGLKRFLCSECPTMLASATSLRQHMSIHKGTRNYLCDECGKSFRMGKALQSHMETHTEQRQYACPQCDKSFKQKSVLQKHVRVVHTESSRNKFTCETCGRRFPYPYLLHHHTTVAHPDNLHMCKICSCRFLQTEALEQHMEFHRNPGERQCAQCLRVFPQDADLEHHECKSFKSNFYYCHRCHISVQGAHLFDIHNRHVHDLKTLTIPKRNRPRKFDEVGEEVIKVECNKCGKVMSSGRLETHMNTHHNIDKFLCKICNKRMKTVTSFTRHKQMHTGIKPFKCDLCPQTFFQKTSLNFHHMEHTGERPAKCKMCPAAFKRFGDLRVHERRHQFSGNLRNSRGQRRVQTLSQANDLQELTIVRIEDIKTDPDSMMEEGNESMSYEDGGHEYSEETYEIDQHAIIEELEELNDQQVYEELIDYEGMIVINKEALETSILTMT